MTYTVGEIPSACEPCGFCIGLISMPLITLWSFYEPSVILKSQKLLQPAMLYVVYHVILSAGQHTHQHTSVDMTSASRVRQSIHTGHRAHYSGDSFSQRRNSHISLKQWPMCRNPAIRQPQTVNLNR